MIENSGRDVVLGSVLAIVTVAVVLFVLGEAYEVEVVPSGEREYHEPPTLIVKHADGVEVGRWCGWRVFHSYGTNVRFWTPDGEYHEIAVADVTRNAAECVGAFDGVDRGSFRLPQRMER